MNTARIVFCLMFSCMLSAACWAVDVGDRAPEWELETVDGDTIEFPKVTGQRPAIVFFWATWCPYCHAVMPYLQKIKADYAKYGVEIYAIDFKDNGDPAEHMAQAGYDFVVLPVGDLVAEDYNVWSAPGLFVVDGNGVVQYRRGQTKAPPGKKIAEMWDRELRTALDRVLAK